MKPKKVLTLSLIALTAFAPTIGARADTTTSTGTVTINGSGIGIDGASSFDFGSTNLLTATQIYAPIAVWQATPPVVNASTVSSVQVSDNSGLLAGWSLEVTPHDLISSNTTGNKVLTGATLTFDHMNIASPSANPATDLGGAVNFDGTGNIVTINVGGQDSTPQSTVMMSAKTGFGTGTNILQFGGTPSTDDGTHSISLNIPNGSALADQYTGTLTWSLTAAP